MVGNRRLRCTVSAFCFLIVQEDDSPLLLRNCREKIGSLFRDSLHDIYRSSGKAKKARRASMNRNSPTPSSPVPSFDL